MIVSQLQLTLCALPNDAGAGVLLTSFCFVRGLPFRLHQQTCKAVGGRRDLLRARHKILYVRNKFLLIKLSLSQRTCLN